MAVVRDRPHQCDRDFGAGNVHRHAGRAAARPHRGALPVQHPHQRLVQAERDPFVAGQTRDTFVGHALVDSFVAAPQFRFRVEDRPRYDVIAPAMIGHDWAILTLHDALPIKPIPVRVVTDGELPFARTGGEIALAGYATDHPYMLSVHRGCDAAIDAPEPGVIAHRCNSAPGKSGGPILLLRGADAAVIGIHSASMQRFDPRGGYQAIGARGVAAAQFAAAVKANR